MSLNNDKESVDMDNPAYAQQDPHLRINDEDEMQGMPMPFRNRYPRRPPLFDSMLNNVRAITKKVEHIKGFKFEVQGALSHNFHLGHSWTIPNGSPAAANARMNPMAAMKPPQQANYTLSAQFLGGSIRTPYDQPAYIMTGRMDSTGKLEAAVIKKINDWISLRLSAFYMNSDPMHAQMHLDVDVTGDDYVHTIKWGTGVFSFNIMQTIGRRLVLGFELMNLTERKATMMSYAAKFALNKRQMLYAQYVGPADQLILAYNHKILEKAFLVSELTYSKQDGETNAVLGFRQKFATSEVIATLNSKGKMSTILSMSGIAYQLKLCSVADYVKDSYKFGYGISMGQVG